MAGEVSADNLVRPYPNVLRSSYAIARTQQRPTACVRDKHIVPRVLLFFARPAGRTCSSKKAPGARNMPAALGKESCGDDWSSNSHVAKKSKENRPPFLRGPSDERAVGRVISKDDTDDQRTNKAHGMPTAPMGGDSIRSSSPSKRARGGRDDGGGRGVAIPPDHARKKHASHSDDTSRSHVGGDAGGGSVAVLKCSHVRPTRIKRRPRGSAEREVC